MARDHAERIRFMACAASIAMHALLTAGIAHRSLDVGGDADGRSSIRRDPLLSMRIEPAAAETPLDPTPRQPPALPPTPPPQPLPPRPDEVVLGAADGGDLPTENWMGFAEPTPHQAPLSEVNQPQLDLQSGGGGDGGQGDSGPAQQLPAQARVSPVVPVPASLPEPPEVPAPPVRALAPDEQPPAQNPVPASAEPDPATRPDETPKLPEGGAATPADEPDEVEPLDGSLPTRPEGNEQQPDRADVPIVPVSDPANQARTERPLEERRDSVFPAELERALSDWEVVALPPALPVVETPPKPAPEATAPAEALPAAPQEPANSASPASEQSSSGAGGASGEGLGEQSDRQSDASSTEPSTQVRPGHPVAAKGLEIITRRPVFSKVTRVTAFPKNPSVEATFGRNGRVIRARVTESSGYSDVDQPVLDAVYSWTARGEALNGISRRDPQAGITLKFTILLR